MFSARVLRSCVLCLTLLLLWLPAYAQEKLPTADVALQKLKEGNARFVADKPTAKDTGKVREKLAQGQHPFAIVLTCADSRVAPELVFDQGLGQLFVLRVAGNIADPNNIGSAEYGVHHLHAPLIVVLGHESCGAVEAVVAGAKIEGNLGTLLKSVQPGKDLPKDKTAALASGVRANAQYQAEQLTKQSKVIKELVESGRVKIVTGIYSLKTGEVEWLK